MQIISVLIRFIRLMQRPFLRAEVPAFCALLLLCVVSGCTLTGEAPQDAWPQALGAPVGADMDVRQLVNDGFVVGYDNQRQQAAWVAYRVRPVTARRAMRRPRFTPDPRLPVLAQAERPPWPGYDRGHLAPNYFVSRVHGVLAQTQSFYYSNIAPQRPRLNQLVWQRLEEIEVDALAASHSALWVMLGPVPADNTSIPEAFYRIWIARGKDGSWRSLALRVPQSVRGDERLSDFLVSIDRIEVETGLDFFSGLDRSRQQALEAKASLTSVLGFSRLACKPARYGRRWQDRDGIHLDYERCDPLR